MQVLQLLLREQECNKIEKSKKNKMIHECKYTVKEKININVIIIL